MTTMSSRRYVIAALLLTAGGLTACSATNTDTASSAPSNTADIASICQDAANDYTVLDWINDATDQGAGAPQNDEQRNRTACDNYRAGTELTQLRNLPVTWDQQCLKGAGWALSGNQTPIQPNSTENHYYPAEAAHCASPVVTPEVCESVRQALAPQQAALNYQTASVITKLGCTNIEVQMPS